MSVGLNSDASAVGAPMRADARLAAEIDDFFLPDDARLDDRTRLATARMLAEMIGGIEGDIRRHAARLLAKHGRDAAAEALAGGGSVATARLTAAGLLRDPEMMEEVIARVRGARMTDLLPPVIEADGRPSFLLRLADQPDGVVATAARALLAADSRRPGSGPELSAELYHRLVWWVAAAIREDGPDAATDRALAGAAQRCLLAHDEGDRPEALAARLVVALDPAPAEVPALLLDALGDRRLTLFIALLARALGIDLDVARSLVLDPDAERLWPALRAIDMSRADIAHVALALSEADPRRDIEELADRLDAIAATSPATARGTVEPLALPRDFRLAIAMLEGCR